jgi:hypothetical protein
MAAGCLKLSSLRFFILVFVGAFALQFNQFTIGDTVIQYCEHYISELTPGVIPKIAYIDRISGHGRGKAYLSTRIQYSSKSIGTFQLQRLALSGDVHINPGPTVKEKPKCPTCQRTIAVNHRAATCDSCKKIFHIKCGEITSKQYRVLTSAETIVKWTCPACALASLASLPFSTLSDDMFNNLFSHKTGSNSENDYSQLINKSDSNSAEFAASEWFNTNINSYYKNNLMIAHLNINSICGKVDEVIDLLNTCKFDVLAISESKIDNSVSNSLLQHSKYRIIRRDRKRGAGGILVYIRSTITAVRRVNLEPEGIESICLDIKGCGNSWFIVCACYRSPGKCKISDFIPSCVDAAERMYVKRKEIIFIGDFNMDMLIGQNNPQRPNQDLSNFIEQPCLTNLITNPTRVTKSTKSLLDVILVSHPDRFVTSGNLHLRISDHDLIYVVRKQKLPKTKAKSIEISSIFY